MSHTKVKTTYSVPGAYGSTETKILYCHHNHSSDFTVFFDEDGSEMRMFFHSWKENDNLWDAMQRLWFPFKDKWGEELKEGVEYYTEIPNK